MAQKVLDALKAAHGAAVDRTISAHTDEIAWIKRDHLLAVATWLKNDAAMAFDAPVFCTCIDWIDYKPLDRPPSEAWSEAKPRFTVAYQLRSSKHRHRIRL
jgi:NADH:ubiquinone oxidoreductase subunit C